jgi:hypothetical protein
VSIFANKLINQAIEKAYQHSRKNWPWLIAAVLLIRFAYRVIAVSLSFSNLFQAGDFLASSRTLFILPIAITLVAAATWMFTTRQRGQRKLFAARFGEFVRTNTPGLLLGFIFFIIYLVLAAAFNRTDFNNITMCFLPPTLTNGKYALPALVDI